MLFRVVDTAISTMRRKATAVMNRYTHQLSALMHRPKSFTCWTTMAILADAAQRGERAARALRVPKVLPWVSTGQIGQHIHVQGYLESNA
jgi:hypothetical protein